MQKPRKKPNLIEATNPNAKDGLGNAHFVNSSNVVQLETCFERRFDLLTDRSTDTSKYASTQHSKATVVTDAFERRF